MEQQFVLISEKKNAKINTHKSLCNVWCELIEKYNTSIIISGFEHFLVDGYEPYAKNIPDENEAKHDLVMILADENGIITSPSFGIIGRPPPR